MGQRSALTIWATALAFVAAVPARAAGPEDPEAVVAPELVVRASLPGPPWWRVEHGGSVVYVMAVPDEPLAKGQTWNFSVLQARLTGASQLIVPVRVTAGLGDIPALLKIRGELRSRQPLEQTLPEALKVRFVAARMRLGRPESRYRAWDALIAGQILADDFQRSAGATRDEPIATIRHLAGQARVPIRPAGAYHAMDIIKPAVTRLTPEVSDACLGEALDEVDRGDAALRASGAAWARGDVPAVLAGPHGFSACLLLLSGGADYWRRIVQLDVDAISASLQRPGHAVAVFPLRSLVAENGVLTELKARGFEVTIGG